MEILVKDSNICIEAWAVKWRYWLKKYTVAFKLKNWTEFQQSQSPTSKLPALLSIPFFCSYFAYSYMNYDLPRFPTKNKYHVGMELNTYGLSVWDTCTWLISIVWLCIYASINKNSLDWLNGTWNHPIKNNVELWTWTFILKISKAQVTEI